ncbi:hypothetical protein [Aequorivita lipolytica]|uniref:Plug domain-containing protein n=1 Tax=Aequorivita lipolytica TaxID=153267 RepID=A0A5C6YND8_9FLAO|nr:hypothetical protein [Aequorivita lipolytica]TXD68692.1 hypothetical protein ESV24_11040 [Aequorivita lipolytica]SRX53166.1 hypothetical protein AEQU2_02394 [Aequorivita lipolytica]
MKTLFKNLAFGFLFLSIIPVASAQTYKENDDNTDGEQVVVQGQKISPEMLANLGIVGTPNPRNATVEGNSIFIRQIGDFNTASIRTATNASEINLFQNGNSNDTQLDYLANTAIADLVQNGNNNRIKDFVNAPNEDISLDLTQNGNNLNFERNGVNELTKSLRFKQTEASPTIIVRSYF